MKSYRSNRWQTASRHLPLCGIHRRRVTSRAAQSSTANGRAFGLILLGLISPRLVLPGLAIAGASIGTRAFRGLKNELA